MQNIRDRLEGYQVSLYFGAVVLAGLIALLIPGTVALEGMVNPALAFMLFATFLQVPLADLRRSLTRGRFLAALFAANFVAIPLLVALMLQFLPSDPMVRLGVLLVLLTPCIDYVVTFSHLGRADARLLLAATPVLLVAQLLLLPFYLSLLLSNEVTILVKPGPFIEAFIWLIAVPLALAGLVQLWATRRQAGAKALVTLSVLPVPATVFVLFVVVATVVPQLGAAIEAALLVIPFYLAFAVIAPLVGWAIGLLFRLDAPAGRALAFSAGTRNSLVILPLALAVPGAIPLLPAVIVTQTLVELLSELVYVRYIAKLGGRDLAVS
ncbi:arsenic resistance protein [Pseudomonas sp. gcc21]|uniref:arsenic resistance protein n=1 Tax=Pseudomonas sp. gcc21 TaxID=2726989 RepID=UPI0014521981|nr:arsenic resistance protein [Pseudomonas sp. gcc21]QJD57564.1 arsenic resistance protein [Pseudomonas sp. gcc21]